MVFFGCEKRYPYTQLYMIVSYQDILRPRGVDFLLYVITIDVPVFTLSLMPYERNLYPFFRVWLIYTPAVKQKNGTVRGPAIPDWHNIHDDFKGESKIMQFKKHEGPWKKNGAGFHAELSQPPSIACMLKQRWERGLTSNLSLITPAPSSQSDSMRQFIKSHNGCHRGHTINFNQFQ